jgi:hypothetical protein
MELVLLEDRDLTVGLDPILARQLQSLGIVESRTVDRIFFCGVAVVDHRILVIVPRNLKRSVATKGLPTAQIASLILRVLDRYHSSSNSSLRADSEYDDSNESLDSLSRILWLLNDFARNGLYSTSIKIREFDCGKINWNRTIRKEIPYVGIGGSPIYMRFHSERLRYDEQSPISLIHADVIRELDHLFSWAITGDTATRIAADLDSIPMSPHSRDSRIGLLRRELGATFADRKIRLLNSLIGFLESRHGARGGEYVVGTRSFQNVWEDMLRCTIPNVQKLNHLLPKPGIALRGKEKAVLARGMITDLVSRRENVMCVIDAKYYNAESVGDSPGWADIVKQFYYARAVHEVFPNKEITNWFAFPGEAPALNEGPLTSIALIDIQSGQALEDFPPIGCAYFCPVDVMSKYVSSTRYSHSDLSALYFSARFTNAHSG